MARLIEEKVVGSVGIGKSEETAPTGEAPYYPPYTPPATPPVAPSRRAEMTRSQYYTQHEKILKELNREGKRGKCLTPEDIATKTNIDIEDVKEHLSIITLDEAGAEIHEKSGVVCATDAMQHLVENLRKLRT